MKESGQFHGPALYLWGKIPRFSFDRIRYVAGNQSKYGLCG
jgi:hypothetical protein